MGRSWTSILIGTAMACALAAPIVRVWGQGTPASRVGSTTAPAPAAPTTRPIGPPGSVITFRFTKAPPKDVFAELGRQMGLDLRTYPRNLWESQEWSAIDIDLEGVSFWRAIRELGEKTNLTFQKMGMDRELVVVHGAARPWQNLPTSEHGPFLVVAHSMYRSQSVDLSQGGEVKRGCQLRLTLYAEPKVKVLRGLYSARIEEAVDERGQALVAQATAQERMSGSSSWGWSMTAMLTPPPNVGRRLVKLRGSGKLVVQTRSERAEIEDVLDARSVTRVVDGSRLQLKEVKQTGENYLVAVTIERGGAGGGGGANGSEWTEQSVSAMFRMVDAAGESLTRRNTVSGTPGQDEQMNLNLSFSRQDWNGQVAAGEPAKLIWEVPVETAEVAVPFEFRDLPIP